MSKTLLSILIGLVFVFGAAGVTVAAAQQSQPGEPLYALRTWSTQMFRQQDKTQVSEQMSQIQSSIHELEMTQPQISGQVEQRIRTQWGIHAVEITQTPQSPTSLDVCDQTGTNGQCGSGQQVGVDHVNDHAHQEGENHEAHRQNDGSEHGQNDH